MIYICCAMDIMKSIPTQSWHLMLSWLPHHMSCSQCDNYKVNNKSMYLLRSRMLPVSMHQYKAPRKAHLSPFFQCYLVGAFPVHNAFHVYKDRPWTKCCKYVPLTFFTLPLRSCPKTWINQVNQEDGTSRVNQTLEHMYLLHPATTRKGATATAAALAQQ